MSHFLAISKFTTSILEGPAVHSHKIDIYLRDVALPFLSAGTLARTTIQGFMECLMCKYEIPHKMASNISPHHGGGMGVGPWPWESLVISHAISSRSSWPHRKLESKKDRLSGSKQWDLVGIDICKGRGRKQNWSRGSHRLNADLRKFLPAPQGNSGAKIPEESEESYFGQTCLGSCVTALLSHWPEAAQERDLSSKAETNPTHSWAVSPSGRGVSNTSVGQPQSSPLVTLIHISTHVQREAYPRLLQA